MKIDIVKKLDNRMQEDEMIIEIYSSAQKQDLNEFVESLNDFISKYDKKIVATNNDYTLMEIDYKDILIIYSDKKSNYCRTKNGTYKIKSKLYEIEKFSKDFIRISKSCIINIRHSNKFDISEVGKIVIKLDDGSEEIVSRRRTKNIMKYLEERMI